jgi:uncharacterized Fe-S center protein
MPMKLYDDIGKIPVSLKGRVAIKLHMGEAGNRNHVSPRDVAALVKKIKEAGGEPFLVDTTTLYRKGRYTVKGYMDIAKRHGFGRFEVVIADDDDYKSVWGHKVAGPIARADSLLLLTHVTGHVSASLGAAIKNLGMGCVVKDGKRRIHGPLRPVYDGTLCIGCGSCVRTCPYGLISQRGEKVKFDLTDCSACGRCSKACPAGALRRPGNGVARSFKEFSEAARATMSLFERKDFLCISMLKRVTEGCDCGAPSPVVCKDIGYISGKDPLRLDQESVRLIKKEGGELDWKTWERFESIAKDVFR